MLVFTSLYGNYIYDFKNIKKHFATSDRSYEIQFLEILAVLICMLPLNRVIRERFKKNWKDVKNGKSLQ